MPTSLPTPPVPAYYSRLDPQYFLSQPVSDNLRDVYASVAQRSQGVTARGLISVEEHPLASVFGVFENDPMLDIMRERIAEGRARMDAEDEPVG